MRDEHEHHGHSEPELQQAYEAVLGRALDRRNFRRCILALGLRVPLRAARRGKHRPARLFRFARRRPVIVGILTERG